MGDFLSSYNRWRCVMFTVLSAAVILAGLALVYGGLTPEALAAAIILIGVSAMYFFLGRYSHLPQETRYLLRVVPVLFLVAFIAGLLLTGFIVYLAQASQPLRMTAGETSFKDIPRLVVLVFIVLGLLLPFFVIFAARDLMRALRAHHHVGEGSVKFFTRKREWTVRPDEYYALVLGENVVLGCRRRGDVAQAVQYVNRPLQQSWLTSALDGIHYINTERLARDLRLKGYAVQEDRQAFIVRLS